MTCKRAMKKEIEMNNKAALKNKFQKIILI